MKKTQHDPSAAKLNLMVSFLVAAIFAGFGAYCAFSVYPNHVKKSQALQQIPVLKSFGDFNALDLGEQCVLNGKLKSNPVIDEKRNLVAVVEYEWDVRTTDDKDKPTEGSWDEIDAKVPTLTIEVDGGEVKTTSGKPKSLHAVHGPFVISKPSGRNKWQRAKYEDKMLGDGARALKGLKNGDQVVLIGSKGSGVFIKPDYLWADSSVEDIYRSMSTSGMFFLILGCLFMIIGGIIAIIVGRKELPKALGKKKP